MDEASKVRIDVSENPPTSAISGINKISSLCPIKPRSEPYLNYTYAGIFHNVTCSCRAVYATLRYDIRIRVGLFPLFCKCRRDED